MGNWLNKIWLCKLLGMHQWTSKSEQGIQSIVITDSTADKQILRAFYDQCRMYCDCCGKEAEVSRVHRINGYLKHDL